MLVIIVVSIPARLFADGNTLRFTQNKGQWDSRVQFRAHPGGAYVFFEKQAFTYLLYDRQVLQQRHMNLNPPEEIRMHAFQVVFNGSNSNPVIESDGISTDYENYFIGNDASKWASNVYHYNKIRYRNLYNGIDAEVYSESGYMKYDFVVTPGYDPSVIEMEYKHADSLWIKDGALHIQTSLGLVKEQVPLAYQQSGPFQQTVPCRFVLNGNKVKFEFPEGYDKGRELVIDPLLVFSTFTGSTADNFGFTATYDDDGNAYGGGIVYGIGVYPVTPGAFQVSFASGTSSAPTDIAITKFNSVGTGLLYSTYLGGTGSCEAPHSLITDASGNLYILGTTGSADFPVTAGAYDSGFSGGTSISPPGSGLIYTGGTDIIVVKLNAAGTSLLGSTFVGGSQNDGLNSQPGLNYFYGDSFRGEIGLDALGNVWCVTTTQSNTDFPVTPGAPQLTFGGGSSDAVFFELNNGLTTMMLSSYWGGNGNDSGFGLQFSSVGDVYIAGGTASTNLQVSPGVIGAAFSGVRDGYVSRFSSAGTFLASTYLGTSAHDLTYFVQLDLNDDVYVLGVTEGTYPITPGVYANPNSWQYMHKMSNDFTTTHWSTVVGSGTNSSNFSPTAFLVDNCGSLYLSGWGGPVNGLNPPNSNTTGCLVTIDATQSLTDGSDFYLLVMDQNATSIEYATFFGGGVNEHVDGGTSRFDKVGRVYQAVCAGCGGFSSFPTTPGVWSNTNNSPNCNLALFKYDLRIIRPVADFVVDTVNCDLPSQVVFINQSTGAQGYIWDFGDGSPQFNGYSVLHNYSAAGTYTVQLIALDPYDCIINDTAWLDVYIPVPPVVQISAPDTVCPGADVQFTALGDPVYQYQWSGTAVLDDYTIYNPSSFGLGSSVTAIVTVTDTTGCITTDTVVVVVRPGYSALAEFSVNYDSCALPNPVSYTDLSSPGGFSYIWDFGDGSPVQNTPSPQYTYTTEGEYIVTLIVLDSSSCNISDTISLPVTIINPPVVQAISPPPVCFGDTVQLSASGQSQYTYAWSPSLDFSNPADANPILVPDMTSLYYVTVTDTTGCTASDSVLVNVHPVEIVDAGPQILVPVGTAQQLLTIIPDSATVIWTPATGLSCTDCYQPYASPDQNTTYTVWVTDTNGCVYWDTVQVIVESSIYVPNAFSPNGDLMNDYFQAITSGLIEFELFIYNRWGELIYRSSDPEEKWDGTYRGFKSPVDVYVWKIKYIANEEPGIYRSKVGHVTLVR